MKYIEENTLIDELRVACVPVDEKGISGVLGDEKSIVDLIRECPAADVISVVHCRDCSRFHEYIDGEVGTCNLYEINKSPNGYCNEGKQFSSGD